LGGRDAERLVDLATAPGEPTYLALGQRTLAEVAIAEKRWPDAESALDEADLRRSLQPRSSGPGDAGVAPYLFR
jgi:hypothetical protein